MVIPPTVDVRRGADRAVTVADGLRTAHALSGGRHYDPGNTSFGTLVLHDEHLLAPGGGFPAHRHRGVEVVTWVLDGVLRHEDGAGSVTLVRPGQLQVLSTGSGTVHAELNASRDEPVRFVQAWLLADDTTTPTHEVRDVVAEVAGGKLVAVASGHGDAPVRLSVDAALHVARPRAGDPVVVPAAARVHLHVASGAVDLAGVGALGAGDAVRLTASAARRLTAVTDAELLVWVLP